MVPVAVDARLEVALVQTAVSPGNAELNGAVAVGAARKVHVGKSSAHTPKHLITLSVGQAPALVDVVIQPLLLPGQRERGVGVLAHVQRQLVDGVVLLVGVVSRQRICGVTQRHVDCRVAFRV